MTDAAALHAGFSDTVAGMRRDGLVDTCITAGHAIGGDLEAVTIYGALAAARAVVHADVAIVAMGPGNLGTGSRWGSSALSVAGIIDAVAAMSGRPIVAPRISFADERARHHGVSHHTITALQLARARATIAIPTLSAERADLVSQQLHGLDHPVIVEELADLLEATLKETASLRSMGRSFDDDPDYFRTAAAAGCLATRYR
jgi:hypothetical protein